jgi:PAS domain S-box-containing protein
MKPKPRSPGSRGRLFACAGWFLLAGLAGALRLGALAAEAQAPAEIRTVADVRRLTAEQAAQSLPVRLRGVVTFFDGRLYSQFFQDDTAGIYLFVSSNTPALFMSVGQFVEIEGVTSRGEYAPIVVPRSQRLLGMTNLPPARPVSYEQLASGQEDSQLVEVHGVVRSTYVDEATSYLQVEIATGGGRLTAFVTGLPPDQTRNLVDSAVTIRGVCSTQFNRQGQLFHIRILVPRAADFVVQKAAPSDPFAIETQTIGSLLRFTPQGTYGHLVKVSGTVTCQQPGSTLFIEDQQRGLLVQTRQQLPLEPGDRVEVVGFPAQGEYTPILQDALYRKTGSGAPLNPAVITLDEALKGTFDCRLVRLEANLLERAQMTREQSLVLEAGHFVFQAYYEQEANMEALASLQNGSRVMVTGVCLVSPGSGWEAGEAWRAKSFRLLLRSPADVVVLRAPPWWNLRRLLWAVGILIVVILLALAWVGILRRRVQQQTEIIRQKLLAEAALKERYVDLFENANDVVFTHDLNGRVTSINRAGERLLGRSREHILTRRLVELVVPEQQAAAAQWVEQVLQDAAPPTVEWDFALPDGKSLKLEISTRLIEQNGRQVEVEGIGRDITERKRLEREILEISNREQRRIGHDLHDGVCQQLVGISYLTETVAERLLEKGSQEAEEVERISRLLSTAISQTYGVARGLFPVRLAENGLVSALEEMVANAGQLFHTQCRFVCEAAPESIDNALALHLYYIAQEAVANAAKHGKAEWIQVSLRAAQDRYALSIEDNGAGFATGDSSRPGMGLRIMQYRVRVIGAALEIRSQPGQGTTITCLFVPVVRGSPELAPSPAATR